MVDTDSPTTQPAGFSAVQNGRVLRVTLTKPKRKNALDYDSMVALGDTFLVAAQDKSVRAVVLTGAGGDFCTGADLAASVEEGARGITADMVMDAANRLVHAIVDLPVPVIARLRGATAGVGVGIALAADLVYAEADSYLLLAFINIGLMPDGGAGGPRGWRCWANAYPPPRPTPRACSPRSWQAPRNWTPPSRPWPRRSHTARAAPSSSPRRRSTGPP
jgi:enoyl-CoA hydratase